jgi:protein-disulfide isomerase
MTSKRIITWASFIIIIALIVWGLIAAQIKSNKQQELTILPGEVVATDHVRGSETATVTVVEYGDFQCPACAQYYPIVERLFTEDASTTARLQLNPKH